MDARVVDARAVDARAVHARATEAETVGTTPAREGLLPVDLWFAAFNVVALAGWAPFAAEALTARWMVGVHLAALALPWLLAKARRPLHPVVAALREAYPLLWIPAFWFELGVRHAFVSADRNNELIARLDRAIFGTNFSLVWMPAMPAPWLGELMQGTYFAFYVLLAGIPLLVLLSRRRAAFRELALRLAVTWLGCFAVYLVFPVEGPRAMYPERPGLPAEGWFYALNTGVRSAVDSLGTAFPSLHVAGSVTLAWLAWRCCPRAAAWAATGNAVAVAFATVYTGNHFTLDAVAGLLAGVALQGAVAPALQRSRWARPHAGPAAAPGYPLGEGA